MAVKLIQGENDLLTNEPFLCLQWSDTNNKNPEDYAHHSGKHVSWTCEKDHTWTASINSRVSKRSGCPFCSGHRVWIGYNDLKTLKPHLIPEWSIENEHSPENYSVGSGFKAVWECSRGHVWKTKISHRTGVNKSGCPVCSNKQLLKGYNDLATLRPDLAEEWSTRNTISFCDVISGSHKSMWWKCKQGHEWEAQVYTRTSGRGCPSCSGRISVAGKTDLYTTHPHLSNEWSDTNTKTPQNLSSGSDFRAEWVCSYGHRWTTHVYQRTGSKLTGCPRCVNKISKPETELYTQISQNLSDVEVKKNIRSVIPPKELDIYIPSHNLAVEFNGIYWHSEKFKTPNNHQEKWLSCREAGVQLLTIWEDQWRDKPDIIQSMILRKLGVGGEKKIGARKCEIVTLEYQESSEFLERTHIQGKASGSLYLGLEHAGKLVAVAVFRKASSPSQAYLDRYATSCNVQGGFTRLMKEAAKHYSHFITFADLCVSDGSLYTSNGWAHVQTLRPDYRYVYNNERVHKFNFRLKRFRNDPNLLFEDGLSERQLADLNNIHRIYDCGKFKFELRTE